MIGNAEIKKSNASINGNVDSASVIGQIQGRTVLGSAVVGGLSVSGNVEIGSNAANINGSIETASVIGHVQGQTVLGDAKVGSVTVVRTDSPFTVIYNTTNGWNSQPEFVPKSGTIIVYLDKYSYKNEGETVYVPGIKVSDGNAYLIDLPFITDRIENIGVFYSIDTMAGWSGNANYIPQRNELIIYTDKYSYEKDGETVYVPGIKMGDGTSYVVDLPFFLDAIYDAFEKHIKDTTLHITSEERTFWNNKLNCVVDGENLTLNRL